MKSSKWVVGFFSLFYFVLVAITIRGLYLNGIESIEANVFFFVLIGLFILPLILNLSPSLETFNIFGVEFKFKKKIEETEKHVKDLEQRSVENMRKLILTMVKEESLTQEGKRQLIELQGEKNER